MDRKAWRAAVHGVAKSWTRLSDWTELKRINLKSSCHGSGVQRIDTYICMAESIHCSPKTITSLLIGYQFSSVTQSCLILCDPMDCSTLGLHVHHQLPKFTQTQVHWVSYAIQPSHPVPSSSPPALNLSQNQVLFKWVSSSHQVAKVLELQPQHQSLEWIFRTDFL